MRLIWDPESLCIRRGCLQTRGSLIFQVAQTLHDAAPGKLIDTSGLSLIQFAFL